MKNVLKVAWAVVLACALPSCGRKAAVVETLSYEVVSEAPHDSDAFTQGLQWTDGKLYESTGLKGRSSIRVVDRKTGEVLRKRPMPPDIFGEGMTRRGDEIWMLSWQEKTAFVLDAETFRTLRTYSYEGEGWGLTDNGKELIMSNGSDTLFFRSPKDFSVIREVKVTDAGKPVKYLNELEYVKGQVFANIFTTDRIVRIDPETGEVTGRLDLSGLRGRLPAPNRAEVLNGIAYDPAADVFLVTGKWWPRLFEIRLRK